jgi:DNA-binding NarL/FixJ family response regulator
MPYDFLVVSPRGQDPWVNELGHAITQFGEMRTLTGSELGELGENPRTHRWPPPETVIIDGGQDRSTELIGLAKRVFPDTRVALAISAPSNEQMLEAFHAGAADVIEKSLPQRELIEKLIAPTVLLVDNEDELLQAHEELFRDQGWKVHISNGKEDAKRKLDDADLGLDLAILDIRLEGVAETDQSGLALAEEVDQRLPKIIYTGYPSPETTRRAMTLRRPSGNRLAVTVIDKGAPTRNLFEVASRVVKEERRRRRGAETAAPGGAAGTAGLPASAAFKGMVADLVSAELAAITRGDTLDNYSGYLCVREQHRRRHHKNRRHSVATSLVVWMQPDPPQDAVVRSERILISDGRAAAEVSFDISLESDGTRFDYRSGSLVIHPGRASDELVFRVLGDPGGSHAVWLQVFQKNRLVQVVNAEVGGERQAPVPR